VGDEQLARDVADIRVLTAETALQVRQIRRDHRDMQRRLTGLERWRWMVAGAGLVAVTVAQVAVQWWLR
jgi:hypothetical protein